MDEGGPCHQGISQGHSPFLAELYSPFYDSLRYREDGRCGKELLKKTSVCLCEVVVTEHLNIAHG